MTVYVGARDLSGAPLGTHQFIVVTYDHPVQPVVISGKSESARYLGQGTYGFIIGAQHRNGKLVVEFFNQRDADAMQQYFSGIEQNSGTELKPVLYQSKHLNLAKKDIFTLVDAYRIHQQMRDVNYPSAGLGVDIRSWVQSVIEYSGGQLEGDVAGRETGYEKRIPRTYFKPVSPITPRPRLNW